MSASMTIEQIAQLAHVSRSTVSRVLNDHPSVRPQVRERVWAVINEQGYAPDAAARSLASRRTKVIGLIIPRSASETLSDPFFAPVIASITEACTKAGYFLMLAMLTADMEYSFYHRIVRGRHFDGVIMLSSDIDDPILPLLKNDQMPLVLFGSHPFLQNITWVDVDQRGGALQAVNHLLAQGHRRIAHIVGLQTMASAQGRRDGYKQALMEAGIQIRDELMVCGDWSQESGRMAMQQFLELPEPPTAVFAANDAMAMGAMMAVNEAGLRVPEDIALIGFDNLSIGKLSTPPLTTIHQPIVQMGEIAVQLLLKQFDADTFTPEQVLMQTRLVVRGTCGA